MSETAGLPLADVDFLLSLAQHQIEHTSTTEEAVDVIRMFRLSLANVRVEDEAEAILAEAAGASDGG